MIPAGRAARTSTVTARRPTRPGAFRPSPYYSVLIRINPREPLVIGTDFVCDLCTDMPQADRRRQDLHLQDPRGRQVPGRHAADRGRRGGELERDHLSAGRGAERPRQQFSRYLIEKIESPDPTTVVFHLKFATGAFLPALADPFAYIYEQEDPRRSRARGRTGTRRMSSGPARSNSPITRPASRSRATATPTTT